VNPFTLPETFEIIAALRYKGPARLGVC
jgi:hypothetical protein